MPEYIRGKLCSSTFNSITFTNLQWTIRASVCPRHRTKENSTVRHQLIHTRVAKLGYFEMKVGMNLKIWYNENRAASLGTPHSHCVALGKR